MSQHNFTPTKLDLQLTPRPARPPWLAEIDALDDLTPSFDAYPWRGILRVAYWCARRNLPSLGELVIWQFLKVAEREGEP